MNRISLTCPVLLLLALTACGAVESSNAGTPCQEVASVNLARSVRVPYDTERFEALPGGGESERFRVTLLDRGEVLERYAFTCLESASGSVKLTWTQLP
ncbi:hypothetical protein [Deinococcus arenae]|uniref:hypothetical protein n=1 Tax=Deinococcus arenae TaxID=1452751 RepID=UPI000D7DA92C|nr:hypothetical protein [Deinococcus arenae]AWT35959.1 hypothetical protein DM785_10595 [Deinococcus actinosclerus]